MDFSLLFFFSSCPCFLLSLHFHRFLEKDVQERRTRQCVEGVFLLPGEVHGPSAQHSLPDPLLRAMALPFIRKIHYLSSKLADPVIFLFCAVFLELNRLLQPSSFLYTSDDDDHTYSPPSSTRYFIHPTTYHTRRIDYVVAATPTTPATITPAHIMQSRRYARRVINTSESKWEVIRQFWDEKGKRYLLWGTLGVAGAIIAAPVVVVLGVVFGASYLFRRAKNRIVARYAGVTLAQYEGLCAHFLRYTLFILFYPLILFHIIISFLIGARAKKEAKNPGFFTRLLMSHFGVEMGFR